MSLRVGVAQRAAGALIGLAVGDALGMPTTGMPRDLVVARYGSVIAGLVPGSLDQPLAPGAPAGTVTSLTRQALVMADLLAKGAGRIDRSVTSALMAQAPPLLGAAPAALTESASIVAGLARMVPLGLALVPGEPLTDAAVTCAKLVCGTSAAVAGAAGLATAISVGLMVDEVRALIDQAGQAVWSARPRGHWVAGADLGAWLNWVATAVPSGAMAAGSPGREVALIEMVTLFIGNGFAERECLPAAFACALAFPDEPWLAVRVAASVGGAASLIAALTGALIGACHGPAVFPAAVVSTVEAVNGLDLVSVATQLADCRGGA